MDPITGAEVRKTRPCIVLSATAINRARRTVVILPLSASGKAKPPIAVPVQCAGRPAVAVCDQIRAVDKTRLRDKLGEMTSAEMDVLAASLRRILWL